MSIDSWGSVRVDSWSCMGIDSWGSDNSLGSDDWFMMNVVDSRNVFNNLFLEI
jgi:hypothetical protein